MEQLKTNETVDESRDFNPWLIYGICLGITLFFMFFFPGFPDDVLCTVAGVLPISWGGFFIMQAVTRVTSIGATLLFMSGQVIPFSGWGLWVLGGVALIAIAAFLLCIKYADKINALFVCFADKIVSIFRKDP